MTNPIIITQYNFLKLKNWITVRANKAAFAFHKNNKNKLNKRNKTFVLDLRELSILTTNVNHNIHSRLNSTNKPEYNCSVILF